MFGNVLGTLRAWVFFGHRTSKNKVKLACTGHAEKFAFALEMKGEDKGRNGRRKEKAQSAERWEPGQTAQSWGLTGGWRGAGGRPSYEVPCLAVSWDSISAPKSSVKTSLFIFLFGGTQKRTVFLYWLYHLHLYLQKSLSGVISGPWVERFAAEPVSFLQCLASFMWWMVSLVFLGLVLEPLVFMRQEMTGCLALPQLAGSSNLFSHLIGACNCIEWLSKTRHCHPLPSDEKPSDLPPNYFQIKRYFGDNGNSPRCLSEWFWQLLPKCSGPEHTTRPQTFHPAQATPCPFSEHLL